MTSIKPIRVVIADDHEMLRSSLTTFFETCDDLLLVGEAVDGEQAVALCVQLQPEVVIMDLHLPGMSGIAATRLIREKCPATCVIVLTYSAAQEDKQTAFEAGASRYLLKDVTIDELAMAVRTVHPCT